jgi:hypothetical protein
MWAGGRTGKVVPRGDDAQLEQGPSGRKTLAR